MSENVGTEKFSGIILVMSVLMWENKNRIKKAETQVKASEASLKDAKTQFYNRLQSLFNKSRTFQENTDGYLHTISSFRNEELLKKAQDSGEISLLNYLLELEHYCESMDKILKTRRDPVNSLVELWAI